MSALAIQQMSWDEKLRTMEELWVSLSQEQPVDWATAKHELRKRAE